MIILLPSMNRAGVVCVGLQKSACPFIKDWGVAV